MQVADTGIQPFRAKNVVKCLVGSQLEWHLVMQEIYCQKKLLPHILNLIIMTIRDILRAQNLSLSADFQLTFQ